MNGYTLHGRPLEIISESKINFPRHAYFMFLNWAWSRYNKKNVTIQSNYELNKLCFFHVENKTNLNFPSIRHIPTNKINFTKSCSVTYYIFSYKTMLHQCHFTLGMEIKLFIVIFATITYLSLCHDPYQFVTL
jgi:hypothetical protein